MERKDRVEMVTRLGELLCARGSFLATAESCTGGLVGHELTSVPGSSNWYVGGIISYANEIKEHVLGVDKTILETKGAVSQACVLAMVQGVCRLTGARVGVAVSGIAGPGGGSEDKPVGTVWMAWQIDTHAWAECMHYGGNRQEIKRQSAAASIRGLVQRLETAGSL
ncbi:MAG: CinA family protein [Desulfoplanes sp.]|jgi:nicotinamide-nucleotide amidase|nr:CinA family protein [Desulfoplanes sp.]